MNIFWYDTQLQSSCLVSSSESDYNRLIQINPNDATLYFDRASLKFQLRNLNYQSGGTEGLKKGAMEDFKKAAKLYQVQGDTSNYERMLTTIKEVQDW